MYDYQREFLRFAIEHEVLRFGEFTLKSGRVSPYFFNSGLFNTGASLARLGEFYAAAILRSGVVFDQLYGPAYKGIPLASAVAIALAQRHQRDVPYVFNRKEAKDHGEGGVTLGAQPRGRMLIIDDVISAGTSIRESIQLIRAHGAIPAGVMIALDRQERGNDGERSAIAQVEHEHGVAVHSIVTFTEISDFVEDSGDWARYRTALNAYRSRYGATTAV